MTDADKLYELALALPGKWRERAAEAEANSKRDEEFERENIAAQAINKTCADELQPFLDALPALKAEWEHKAADEAGRVAWSTAVSIIKGEKWKVVGEPSMKAEQFILPDAWKAISEALAVRRAEWEREARRAEANKYKELVDAAGHLSWATGVEVQGGNRSRSFIIQHRAKCKYWITKVDAAIAALQQSAAQAEEERRT